MSESQDTLAERERCIAILGKVVAAGYTNEQVTRAFKAIKHGKTAESFLLPGERTPPVEA